MWSVVANSKIRFIEVFLKPHWNMSSGGISIEITDPIRQRINDLHAAFRATKNVNILNDIVETINGATYSYTNAIAMDKYNTSYKVNIRAFNTLKEMITMPEYTSEIPILLSLLTTLDTYLQNHRRDLVLESIIDPTIILLTLSSIVSAACANMVSILISAEYVDKALKLLPPALTLSATTTTIGLDTKKRLKVTTAKQITTLIISKSSEIEQLLKEYVTNLGHIFAQNLAVAKKNKEENRSRQAMIGYLRSKSRSRIMSRDIIELSTRITEEITNVSNLLKQIEIVEAEIKSIAAKTGDIVALSFGVFISTIDGIILGNKKRTYDDALLMTHQFSNDHHTMIKNEKIIIATKHKKMFDNLEHLFSLHQNDNRLRVITTTAGIVNISSIKLMEKKNSAKPGFNDFIKTIRQAYNVQTGGNREEPGEKLNVCDLNDIFKDPEEPFIFYSSSPPKKNEKNETKGTKYKQNKTKKRLNE